MFLLPLDDWWTEVWSSMIKTKLWLNTLEMLLKVMVTAVTDNAAPVQRTAIRYGASGLDLWSIIRFLIQQLVIYVEDITLVIFQKVNWLSRRETEGSVNKLISAVGCWAQSWCTLIPTLHAELCTEYNVQYSSYSRHPVILHAAYTTAWRSLQYSVVWRISW